MNDVHISKIAGELNLKKQQVANTAALLGEDATVPFIARYRKERTGSLDEVQITDIRDRLQQLAELDKRREAILTSLQERELLDDELKAKLEAADTMAVLEDLYLPFRPKRRTRATVAREKGLEPLAEALLAQTGINPEEEAASYVTPAADLEKMDDKEKEKAVPSVEEALAGARDIIAETANEDAGIRARMRDLFLGKGQLISEVIDKDKKGADTYKDYFDLKEKAATSPSHRVLAVLRGEREGHLKVTIAPPEEDALKILRDQFVTGTGADSDQVRQAVDDAYKRLLSPSMENETRMELKQRADEAAIAVFCENLRELLLAPPLGRKRVLAIDPGYRTGCKVVTLDAQGNLTDTATVYITAASDEKIAAGEKTIRELVKKHDIEAIAVGNGTASRETFAFVRGLELKDVALVLVNESGASVYSASKVAREEFPDQDVTVRGSISIGRRLMDPLAELVKIDPKSIGVGQYQHDVDQVSLKRGLDDVVVSCVNNVGVDVNMASPQLLSYVSGLGPSLAKNIIDHRSEKGPFSSRTAILDVNRFGPKAFEQSAGFLRVHESENPLDASAVHPESYPIVEQMAADLGITVKDLVGDQELRNKIDLQKYVTDETGMPTLEDIMKELARPGRDPRDDFEAFSFTEGVEKLADLKSGMKLPGIVTNVTAFGAFVDIGVHQDGLVHISHLADQFVKNPADVVKVGQKVEVTVVSVEEGRNRISLSMKKNPFAAPEKKQRKPKRGKRPAGKKGGKPRQASERKPSARPEKPAPNRFSNNPFEALKDMQKKKKKKK